MSILGQIQEITKSCQVRLIFIILQNQFIFKTKPRLIHHEIG